MQIPAPTAQQEGGLSYKWVVACIVVFGIFVTILDTTIVNIAIPRLQNAFGANLDSVQWVLTGYTLAQGVATPSTAFLSNRLGIKRLYLLALACFTLGSALCGLAWSLPVLILFRVIQGTTGAFLTPLAITLLYQVFPPEERGTATGFLGVPILMAPALGPTLGGYIVTFGSWQLIFYINVPIGIIGITLAWLFLRPDQQEAHVSFDLLGFLSSAAGLGLLLYGLSDASTDGWGSGKVLGSLAAGSLLLVAFTFIELNLARRGKQPLLDLRVFKNALFTTSNIASLLVIFALYGGLFLLPIYLQDLRGLSAFQAGLLLLPQAFGSMIAALIGGRLVDRFGVRAVVIPGLIILAVALWLMTSLNLFIPYGQLQLVLILRSFGIGLCMQSLIVSALAQIKPRQLAQASSVNTTLRFVGSSLAVAVIATLVQTQNTVHYYHLAELVTPTSSLGQLVPRLQALFMTQGASAGSAYSAALQLISGELRLQSYILAIQDAFRVSVGLTVVAIVAAFFVNARKKSGPAGPQLPTDATDDEEAKLREEAMMAV